LIDTEWVERSERDWVQQLVLRKAAEKEAQPLELGAEKAKTIETEITHFKSLMTSLKAPSKSSTAPLDELLRNWAQVASIQEAGRVRQ
jgi:hypothetical protein